MEALGYFFLLCLLAVYLPTILEFLICFVLERQYKKLCDKNKETKKK